MFLSTFLQKSLMAVSYTHLDVYKRQAKKRTLVQTLAVERVVRAGEEARACLVVNKERQGELAESQRVAPSSGIFVDTVA